MAHHNSTPASVLEAPEFEPIILWPPQTKRSWRDSLAFGPYTTTKVRKIRKGRKARFNRPN